MGCRIQFIVIFWRLCSQSLGGKWSSAQTDQTEPEFTKKIKNLYCLCFMWVIDNLFY